MPITIDTGVLIALDKKRPRQAVKDLIGGAKDTIVVSANSVVEWWAGGRRHDEILNKLGIQVIAVDTLVARIAAEALRKLSVPKDQQVKYAIDATVIATAALVGGNVLYTGDHDDMAMLAAVSDVLSAVALKPIPS